VAPHFNFILLIYIPGIIQIHSDLGSYSLTKKPIRDPQSKRNMARLFEPIMTMSFGTRIEFALLPRPTTVPNFRLFMR